MKKFLVVSMFLAFGCGPDWQGVCDTCNGVTIIVYNDAGVQSVEDAGIEYDAGIPEVHDAGTPTVKDAGCPPVCKKVCTCTETEYKCSNGKTYTTEPKLCGVTCRKEEVCTKEVEQCY